MYSIIDTPWSTQSKLACLKEAGLRTVIRYYNFQSSSGLPEKRLEPAEAAAISAAGLSLAVVFQQKQNEAGDFSEDEGYRAGQRAASYARDTIGQPAGSGIYFAVDFDASTTEIEQAIKPYFQGVRRAFTEQGGGTPAYRIGSYGSGLVGTTLRDAGLTELLWLSMSRGFCGTQEIYQSGQFNLSQMPVLDVTLCGLGIDYNETPQTDTDFGAFRLPVPGPTAGDVPVAGVGRTYRVTAASGLNVRAGPGTQYAVVGSLASGQDVRVLTEQTGWAEVDSDGDGKPDGFVSTAYLAAV